MIDCPYTYALVNCWLELDEDLEGNATSVPVASVQVDYEINAIPQATVTIPLGREGVTNAPSPAHSKLLSLVEPTPVTIKASLSPRFGVAKRLGVPDGTFTLFEGYTAGFGLDKNMDPPTAALQLQLRHWLSDLDYSSIFSRWGHPANPARYNAAAIPTTSGYGSASYVGPYDPGGGLTEANIEKDLWESALKPFFLGLTKEDGLQIPEQGVEIVSGDGKALPNSTARSALNRIKSYPALAIDTSSDPALAGMIAGEQGIGGVIGKDVQQLAQAQAALSGATFWGLTVGALAPEYMFAVVPRISDAKVVPFIPGVRVPYKKVTADEVAGSRAGGEIARPIRAFGITSSKQFSTLRPASDNDTTASLVGGWYEVPDRAKGIIRIEGPPRWATFAAGYVPFARKSTGVFGGKKGSADQPDAAGPPDPKVLEKLAAQSKASQIFLSRYAHARLVFEHGASRQGTFTGPFRLDIAPGSTISWASTSDLFTDKGKDQLAATLHGTVLRVSFMLSAEPAQAWTTFHLSHVRSAEQNLSPGYSIAAHPLFKDTYKGLPLYQA